MPHESVSARFGAQTLSGVSTPPVSSGAAYVAAAALKTAVALGAVVANVKSPLVLAFQTAYNAGTPSMPLKPDGYWGPKTQAALAEYDVQTPPVPAAVPNYSPPAPQAPTPTAGPTANLRQAAGTLSPASSQDAIRAFQVAWNASGGVPTLAMDGLWGPMTASAVAQALGQAPRVAPPPTFVPPVHRAPRGGGSTNHPSLPGWRAPTDPRPYIFGGTLLAAGLLLAWAPWKDTSRTRDTVPRLPRAKRRA
jgi:hypothetical protein